MRRSARCAESAREGISAPLYVAIRERRLTFCRPVREAAGIRHVGKVHLEDLEVGIEDNLFG